MKNSQDKVIISCAVTGSVHTPTMSEHLPLTPDQIAEQAVEAAQAGAAILHLHARDPRDGRPTADPAVFDQFVPRIRDATDAVINITTGGSTRMTLEERLAYPLRAKPEMCSLNMGSMNFSIHPAARRISQWRHDWEKPYVEGMEDLIFRNTFRDIRHILKVLGEECGTRFEFECYDIGHLYSLAHFVDRGLVQAPFLVQGVFGILGGIGADIENLDYMVQTADRLFGDDYTYSAFAAGRKQMEFTTRSAELGGHSRVGLEDNIFIGKGEKAVSSAQQVEKIIGTLRGLGKEIATPDEAREMLHLKGRAATNIPAP